MFTFVEQVDGVCGEATVCEFDGLGLTPIKGT